MVVKVNQAFVIEFNSEEEESPNNGEEIEGQILNEPEISLIQKHSSNSQ